MSLEFESRPEYLGGLEAACGRKLNSILNEYNDLNTPVLLLLSGGSSLPLLSYVDGSNLSSLVTVTVLDERYSFDSNINNMDQIKNLSFYNKARRAGVSFIDTSVLQNESQEDLARRFDYSLKQWLQSKPDGKIVATVGMGPDGHIAGIMPDQDDRWFMNTFENSSTYIASYDASGKSPYPLRITTNFHFLRKIDQGVCYIVGEGKREAWDNLNASNGSLNMTPARVLRDIKGKVFVFTDLK